RRHVFRTALAITLAAKLAAAVAWYAGGFSAIIGPSRAEATATAEKPAEPAAPRPAAPRDNAAPAAASEQGSRAPSSGAKPADARALIEAITRRQTELDARERDLTAREERLKIF